jgi:Mg-chelatase subunit ChlD
MHRSRILLATITASALLFGASPQANAKVVAADGLVAAKPNKRPVRGKGPRIDVVFVLDTTGSMSGLISSAKQKIWSIANNIASGNPRPDVRFGLVGYRDRGDAYVTKVTQLTRDIDDVYEELMAFSAQGGGDWAEDVNSALAAAISPKMEWSRKGNVLRLVFLVGDAPPHDDYKGPKSYELAAKALRKGIIINAVRAGNAADTGVAWRKIAKAGGGEFMTIAQGGGAVAIATPFDKELGKLNSELADTMVAYGDRRIRAKVAKKTASRKGMSGGVAAAAASYSGKAGHMGHGDLVSELDQGKVSYNAIDEKKLDSKLKKMNKKERVAYLKGMQKKRKQLRKKIASVSKKRDAWISKKEKEIAKKSKRKSFDLEVKSAVREQAASIGVDFD